MAISERMGRWACTCIIHYVHVHVGVCDISRVGSAVSRLAAGCPPKHDGFTAKGRLAFVDHQIGRLSSLLTGEN